MAEATSPDDTETERTALRIVPSEDALAVDALRETFERIHALGTDARLELQLRTTTNRLEYSVLRLRQPLDCRARPQTAVFGEHSDRADDAGDDAA